jgi:hypothetical protein
MGDITVQIEENVVEIDAFETEVEVVATEVEARAVHVVEEGPAGLDAYGVAVEEGFAGTRAQWLASLVGPAGESGTVAYAHNQATAFDSWTINHNLGYKPIVQVFDTGSQLIEAEVSHLSVNIVTILLTAPTAGFARLI